MVIENIQPKAIVNPILPSLKVDNTHSLVEYREGLSFVIHRHDQNGLIDVQKVLENLSAVNKLSGNTLSPLLIDFTSYTSSQPIYTPTARTVLLGSDAAKKCSAIALLFSSEDHIKKSFLFHSSNKHNIPLKFFAHHEEAVQWLKSFILN